MTPQEVITTTLDTEHPMLVEVCNSAIDGTVSAEEWAAATAAMMKDLTLAGYSSGYDIAWQRARRALAGLTIMALVVGVAIGGML